MKDCLFVFDLDDTLYPERDFVRSGFSVVDEYLSSRLGCEGFLKIALARFERGERGKIFDDSLKDLGVNPDQRIISELVAVYRAHRPEIVFFPGAPEFIAKLGGYGHLAVITDGPLICQKNKASALNLSKWFEEIIFTDLLGKGHSKPDPLAFQMLSEKFSAPPEKSVYLADNPGKDFMAPNQLGWKTIQIVHPGQVRPLKDFKEPYSAKFRAEGFKEAYLILKSLFPTVLK